MRGLKSCNIHDAASEHIYTAFAHVKNHANRLGHLDSQNPLDPAKKYETIGFREPAPGERIGSSNHQHN